jgi:Putative peptidoglycan binding domain
MSVPEKTPATAPPATAQARRIRFGSRTLFAALGVAALIAIVVVVTTGVLGGGSSPSSADNTVATGVTRIVERSLSSQTQVSATLGYADPTTLVVSSGTAPSTLQQAQQTVATDEGMLQSAQATLASDTTALAQLRAALTAARAKEVVDCRGSNAAESPSAASGSGGGASGSTPCASDEQTVASTEQSETQAAAKVTADQSQVSSAQRGLAAAQSALAADESSGSIYGQSSAYTALPAIGKIVTRGGSLYSISGQPVVLLYGPVAAWRAFMPGMSAGRDVAELNANLNTLGYGHGLSGDSFTSETSAAIDAYQSAHGLTRTGQLLLGSVVFEPGAVRVTAVTPTIGATVQPGPVLSITSTRRQVTIALDAAQQSQLEVGDPVVITLPDNSTTPGRVSYVGTVATTPSSDQGGGGGGGGSGTPTIEVDVTPSDPAATGHLDQAPVNVSITTASVQRALVVPVNALLALANGGYALEEIGAGGTHQLLAVDLGLFDDQDGLVQVTGSGLAAGQRVVVPSE